jgi:hypothetical protein
VTGFSSYLDVLSVRGKLLALMNLAFFGCVFGVVLALEFLLPPTLYSDTQQSLFDVPFAGNFVLMLLSIFFSNLILSSLIVVTLPGFVFFPLSTVFLVYRAVIWGLLLHYERTWFFLVALPTIVLESQAYALASVAGTVVGASWLMPKRVYRQEVFTRVEAFQKALRECLAIYVFVVIFLFVAAVVETVTLTMMH